MECVKNLRIPVSLADKIEKIDMDGGDGIYMNICPMWDGEDDRFDLDEVSAKEVGQFRNLKHMTVMSAQKLESVKSIAEKQGIEVKML